MQYKIIVKNSSNKQLKIIGIDYGIEQFVVSLMVNKIINWYKKKEKIVDGF